MDDHSLLPAPQQVPLRLLRPRRCRVSELQAALDAANAEKAAAKQQLARLKQQMLTEQDDEEEKIRCGAQDSYIFLGFCNFGWGPLCLWLGRFCLMC
jgi:hypothetical protein